MGIGRFMLVSAALARLGIRSDYARGIAAAHSRKASQICCPAMTPTHDSTTLRPLALRLVQLALAWVVAGWCASASALVFMNGASVSDANFNTSAPTGALANSGWQYTGLYGCCMAGVPIGPRHFVGAAHVGAGVGAVFSFSGATYRTVAMFDDTASDLRIWQIDGTFPAGSWAPLYRASTEEARRLVVIGNGNGRGPEVQVGGVRKGWQWSGSDGRLRWGLNRVESYAAMEKLWSPIDRNLLYANFDDNGDSDPLVNANEAHAAGGDSSAPVFVDDGTGWKLAGVTYAVLCCFSTSSGAPTFNASIYQVQGLYLGPPGGTGSFLVTSPRPGFFAATRVSQRLAWIDSILARTPQTISFPPIADRPLNQSPFAPTVTASSGLPVTLSVVSGPATVNGNAVTLTGLGSVTLKAAQGGDGTYLPATPVQQTFDVTTVVGGGGSEGTAQVPLPAWAAALLAAALAVAGLGRALRPRRTASRRLSPTR